MAYYPQQNFNAMRQDAIRRSKEMQRRASAPAPPPAAPSEGQNYINTTAESKAAAGHTASFSGNLPKELQSLLQGWDGERLALAALLYFLYKEGADPKLLLAIAYIML